MKRTLIALLASTTIAGPVAAADFQTFEEQVEQSVTGLEQGVQSLEQRVTTLENAETDVDLSGVKDSITDVKASIDALEQAHSSLAERVKAEEAETPPDVSGLRDQVKSNKQTLTNLQDQVSNIASTLEQMQDGGSGGDDQTGSVTCDKLADINPEYAEYRPACDSKVIHVGADRAYDHPAKAIADARDGDVILVHGGTYSGNGSPYHSDTIGLVRYDITLIGVGDVVWVADGENVTKGLITTHGGDGATPDHTYIENITFKNSHSYDHNGAGIRVTGGSLTVVGSTFVGNQNGILGGDDGATMIVRDSTFDGNGYGDGKAHGIYANKGAELRVLNSTFRNTDTGHDIKSLVGRTAVRGNELLGGANKSMSVDVTGGGDLLVENNKIVQPKASDNPNIIWYATNRRDRLAGDVVVRNNTVVNEYTDKGGGTFVAVDIADQPNVTAQITGNEITGDLNLSTGRYVSQGNTLNGKRLPEGTFDPDWPMQRRDLPDALGEVPKPMMEQSWPTDGGVYKFAGWGEHTLEGTDGRDVLEARQKGGKTLKGGKGDDVYLPWGQYEIVEQAGGGRDWYVVTYGGWAVQLPPHVEGFVAYTKQSYNQAVTGNDQDNVMIGSVAGGNELNGKAGDDTFYTGAGGNKYKGGTGTDTVVYDGPRADYTVEGGTVTHPDGSTDTLRSIERLVFSDGQERL